MALILGCVSCNNTNNDEGSVPTEGTPTAMKLSFSFPKVLRPQATSDPNATNAEAALVSADVFIYEPSGIQVQHVRLAAADFTQGASSANSDTYTANASIATTTGSKKVFVGVNLPLALSTSLDGAPLNTITSTPLTVTVTDFINPVNGFSMFSQTETNVVLVADAAANTVSIPVQRLSAKVTVHESSAIVIVAPGTLGQLEFSMFNSNRQMYLLQRPDFKDPNWVSGSWNPIYFENFTNYLPVNASTVTDVNLFNTQYATENTSEDHLQKETTYSSIRTTFIPSSYTVFANGTDNTLGYTTTPTLIVTPQTFYTVASSGGVINYFFDIAVATQYAADFLSTVVTYTDGFCYYNMYLNPRGVGGATVASFDMLRNAYYKATITRILAPGNPTPFPTNPDLPVEIPTNITVDVEILFWQLVPDDYELKP